VNELPMVELVEVSKRFGLFTAVAQASGGRQRQAIGLHPPGM
jgi:hypothetical protein